MCGGGFDYYGEGLLAKKVSRPFWVLTVTAKLMLASLTLTFVFLLRASVVLKRFEFLELRRDSAVLALPSSVTTR